MPLFPFAKPLPLLDIQTPAVDHTVPEAFVMKYERLREKFPPSIDDGRALRSGRERMKFGNGRPQTAGLSQSATLRRRRALAITETELKLMAALASIGLSSQPRNGYRTPAATGMPITL